MLDELEAQRPQLLRHCYRMLGSFADAEDLVEETLMKARASSRARLPLLRIATNGCLDFLKKHHHLHLPQRESEPAAIVDAYGTLEETHWLTPAPDAKLFTSQAEAAGKRESVALAFIALLQHLPPKPRAVLLLRDIAGWPAAEVAQSLALSVPAVNSALHRARRSLKGADETAAKDQEPDPELLRAYVRSWEEHDVQGLVALLRKEVVFAMPPHALWFRVARTVARFVQTGRFEPWSSGLRVRLTRANGCPALAFYLRSDRTYKLHSLQLVRFSRGQVAEAVTFIGAHYLRGFQLPRTISKGAAQKLQRR
ncbi:MAG TPA: RNA polymerase subunit sigma-70 [Myxococcales bacterium]|nr:RNA polymerase subunit sigma-70 [Myxococcales bacterium]